ncbi:hypothetical protein GJ496_009002 [Pomphorhynchus laevis]|nr:hypothetical protein GJ496_009002 [Pomphorhynchus laevis]
MDAERKNIWLNRIRSVKHYHSPYLLIEDVEAYGNYVYSHIRKRIKQKYLLRPAPTPLPQSKQQINYIDPLVTDNSVSSLLDDMIEFLEDDDIIQSINSCC